MLLIAGPCVVESKEILEQTVESILESIHTMVDIDFYFKSSLIKDNRTVTENFNTVGLLKAKMWMTDIKREYNVKICTDFHSSEMIINEAGQFDIIQIPAFLARQNSILETAAKKAAITGAKILIKKPQLTNPADMYKFRKNLLSYKLEGYGLEDDSKIIFCDRGTQFGYDQVIMDPRHIEIMRNWNLVDSKLKVIADISHPQKGYNMGVPHHVLAWRLGLAYIAAGSDGIFFETHPHPNEALCDRDTQVPLGYDQKIIKDSYQLWRTIQSYNS